MDFLKNLIKKKKKALKNVKTTDHKHEESKLKEKVLKEQEKELMKVKLYKREMCDQVIQKIKKDIISKGSEIKVGTLLTLPLYIISIKELFSKTNNK